MLVILSGKGTTVLKVVSDDLLELLVFGEEVEFCFECIANIDTKLGINFHTTCYVEEEMYIFVLERA
jgi:hypothetical protein